MTLIEQRAADSLVNNLPRITRAVERICTEVIRANNLKALSIRLGIEERKQEAENKGDEKLKNDLFEFDLTLEAIMKGIS